MKRLLMCLLVVGAVSMFAAGCKTTEKSAKEHPVAEHPAKMDAPKDHPAH